MLIIEFDSSQKKASWSKRSSIAIKPGDGSIMVTSRGTRVTALKQAKIICRDVVCSKATSALYPWPRQTWQSPSLLGAIRGIPWRKNLYVTKLYVPGRAYEYYDSTHRIPTS